MAILLLAPIVLGQSSITVCTTLDDGFNMVTNGIAPSAVTNDADLQGFDVDLRRLVFGRLQQTYKVRVTDSYGELQVRTRLGECDVGWAPVYITAEREQCAVSATCDALPSDVDTVNHSSGRHTRGWERYRCCTDYSVPYMTWTVAVMFHADASAASSSFFASMLSLFTDPFFINFLCFTFIWLTLFSHLMWLAERRVADSLFPKAYVSGIDDCIWWAVVTITTVGYGDRVPTSAAGRTVALMWMIFGLAMFSVLTGHMSKKFLEAGMEGGVTSARDLNNWRLCGLWLTQRGCTHHHSPLHLCTVSSHALLCVSNCVCALCVVAQVWIRRHF